MTHKDTTGLAWSGRPAPKSSGGFVDGVSMNGAGPSLAVDPNGVVGAARRRGRAANLEGSGEGPNLTVTRMDAGSEPPITAVGRLRTPR
jgi:hypothetical protein